MVNCAVARAVVFPSHTPLTAFDCAVVRVTALTSRTTSTVLYHSDLLIHPVNDLRAYSCKLNRSVGQIGSLDIEHVLSIIDSVDVSQVKHTQSFRTNTSQVCFV